MELQHLALRVSDIRRSAEFYQYVFDGVLRTRPVVRSGPFVEKVLGGPPGVTQKGCHISFARGGIELIEISDAPVVQDERWRRPILHVCIQVSDVHATADRAVASGGHLFFPVNDETGRPFVYCADPDGHVLELVEMTFDEAVASVHTVVPGSDPAADVTR